MKLNPDPELNGNPIFRMRLFAATLLSYIYPQIFSRKVSLYHCLGSYRNEPTTSRAGHAPASILHLHGVSICCVEKYIDAQTWF